MRALIRAVRAERLATSRARTASTAPVFGLGDALGLAAERGAGGLDGVERIGLGTTSPLFSVRSVDLEHADARSGQELGQPCPIGARTLDPHFGDGAEGLEPAQQVLVAPGRGLERSGAQQGTDRIEGCCHVDLEVGVNAPGDSTRAFYDGHGHPFSR
jgi:hypothetical protein